MKNKQRVYEFLVNYSREDQEEVPKCTTTFLSEQLAMQRSNLSAILNALVREGKVIKYRGRPVLYGVKPARADSAFDSLYGKESFFKEAIETINAALNFPEETKKVLLIGKDGSGTTDLAQAAMRYAYAKRMIGSKDLQIYDVRDDSQDNFISNEGFYLIRNAQLLSHSAYEKLLNERRGVIFFQASEEVSSLLEDVRFIVHLPDVNNLSLPDRFGFIEQICQKEAKRLNDRLIINSGLMQCLLVYNCQGGFKQLRLDVEKGVANAFKRQKSGALTLQLNDFGAAIRRSLLAMKNRQDVREFLAHTALFIFTAETTLKTREKEIETDLYQLVYEKRKRLAQMLNAAPDHQVSENIQDYLHDLYQLYQENSEENVINEELQTLMGSFLKEAGEKLNRHYDHAYVMSIALHIQSGLIIDQKPLLSYAVMMDLADAYNQEYLLSRQFLRQVEEATGKKTVLDESLFLSLFLASVSETKLEKQVVVLIAMHGQAASAVQDVVLQLMPKNQVYSFDMALEEDLNATYERLKTCVQTIDQGMGIQVIYDMGSFKVMLNSIAEEVHVPIRCLEMPVPLLVMSALKLADQGYRLEEVHNRLLDYANAGSVMKNVNGKILVAFSTREEKASEDIKKQLKALDGAADYEVYSFEADGPEDFARQIDALLMIGSLEAVIGTYDPHFFNVRYIEATRLENVTSMRELLEKEESFDILGYLESQFEAFSRADLEKTIVPFMDDFQRILSIDLDEDAYVGLMVHMACLVDRLMKNKTPIVNFDSDKIIEKYPQETKALTQSLESIARYFHISFLEGDVATLIHIVKR